MENNDLKNNPQDKVNIEDIFVPEKPKVVIDDRKQPLPQQTKELPKKNPSNSIYLWIFFGLVLLIFIGLLIMSVYMLQSAGGERVFQTFGISVTTATAVLRNIINGVYIFFSLIFFVMLLIGAGILASADKKSPIRGTGIKSVSFSILFLIILAISYVGLFPVLYKDQIANNFKKDYSKYIVVNPNPPQGSAPLRVFVDATQIDQSNKNLFFEWDFGDDSALATGPKTSHEYTKPGIYSVKLSVSNSQGKEDINPNITVLIHNTTAVPKITTDVTQGKGPLTVHFDAGTSEDPNGEIIEYIWNFGDDESEVNQAKGIETIHTFNAEGNYEVTLTIKDESGETRSITKSILVTSEETGIQPKIVASPEKGSAPLKVTFNATGSTHSEANKTLVSYEWDFGDGTPIVRSREISHTFSENGIYNVILTITDSDDASVQESIEIEVTDKLANPEAKIISEPVILNGSAPFEINFNGNASIDLDGEIVSYKWTFGDGSPNEVGPNVTHSYSKKGQYTVMLEVSDNDGKKGVTTAVVTVKDSQAMEPTAELKTDPSPPQGNIPLVVSFDASESSDTDGDILSYEWDFGDGSKVLQTTSPKTTHKFDKVGLWPVTLKVYDNDGLFSTKNIKVAVNTIAPTAEFEASKLSAYAPAEISFDASNSTGDIIDYSWDFDDGNSDSGLLVTHVFKDPKTYNVTLTIEDAQGQIDTKNITIKIN